MSNNKLLALHFHTESRTITIQGPFDVDPNIASKELIEAILNKKRLNHAAMKLLDPEKENVANLYILPTKMLENCIIQLEVLTGNEENETTS